MAKLQLAFELSENFASVALIESGSVKPITHFLFEGKKDFQYKERLASCLKDHNLENLEADEITVSWVDPHATLIPVSLFKPEELDSYFQASFNKKVAHNEIDYNRIFSHSVVTVYEIPMWVKSFFVTRFPRVNILHAYSHLIKASSESMTQPAEIFCLAYPDLLLICLSKAGAIQYCNSFEIGGQEDLLYYLAYVVQQNEAYKQARLQLSLHPTVSFTDETQLQQEMQRMSLLKELQLQFNPHYSFKIQEFCV